LIIRLRIVLPQNTVEWDCAGRCVDKPSCCVSLYKSHRQENVSKAIARTFRVQETGSSVCSSCKSPQYSVCFPSVETLQSEQKQTD